MYATRGSRRIAQHQTRTALVRPEIPGTACSAETPGCRAVVTVMGVVSSDGLSRLRAFLEKRDQRAGLEESHEILQLPCATPLSHPCGEAPTVFGRYPAMRVIRKLRENRHAVTACHASSEKLMATGLRGAHFRSEVLGYEEDVHPSRLAT